MAEIRTGKPDTTPDAPSHTKGVYEGNSVGAYEAQPGHHRDGTTDARRSTGVSPRTHDSTLPVMPSLPPG